MAKASQRATEDWVRFFERNKTNDRIAPWHEVFEAGRASGHDAGYLKGYFFASNAVQERERSVYLFEQPELSMWERICHG